MSKEKPQGWLPMLEPGEKYVRVADAAPSRGRHVMPSDVSARAMYTWHDGHWSMNGIRYEECPEYLLHGCPEDDAKHFP